MFRSRLSKVIGAWFAKHHNRIQFFGYEIANIVLVLSELLRSGMTSYGFTHETYAALSLLVGSLLIWRFDPDSRPHLLCLGGLALTVGGVFLLLAGYHATGAAVTLASLETARGGLAVLRTSAKRTGHSVSTVTRVSEIVSEVLVGWYAAFVNRLTLRWRRFGRFINERPFVTGTLIKAPMRLEFVGKKALEGDVVGAAVGVSWMIFGDGGLAFNDQRLKSFVVERCARA